MLSSAQYTNYMHNVGNGADGLHNPITSWFWWCWNANSGDTGGIVSSFYYQMQMLLPSLVSNAQLGQEGNTSNLHLRPSNVCRHFRMRLVQLG